MIQFDLFKPIPTEIELLRDEVEEIRVSTSKVRKSLFAKHGELAKMYLEIREEFDAWKRAVARGK